MMNHLRQRWEATSINRKFSVASAAILFLLLIVSGSSAVSNWQVQREVENHALVAAEVQRTALEADRQFRQAAVLQRDFFAKYQVIGLNQAQTDYALPAVDLMVNVIEMSKSLDTLIPESDQEAFDFDILSAYKDVSNQFQNTFIEAASFITILTQPEIGLEPQFDQVANEIEQHLSASDELGERWSELRSFEREYFIVRTPEAMLFVFGKAEALRDQLVDATGLEAEDRNQALKKLDIYIAIAEDIVAVDREIAALQANFEAAQAAVDGVSERLLQYANAEFIAAQSEIAQISNQARLVNFISIAFAFLISFFIVRLLRQSLTDKVIGLRETAQAYQNRQLHVRSNLVGPDEIGQLALAFNHMAEDISRLLVDLEARNVEVSNANQSLERELLSRKKIQVTLEKNEQQLREHAQDLERSNEELEEFAYIVSHDLRAPLRGIATLVTWLEADYIDAFDEMGIEMLGLMRIRVKRLEGLIEGILEFSRVGRHEAEHESVEIYPLIEQVIDVLDPPDHIKFYLEPEMPSLLGNPIRYGQIFQNLLDNAIKYMDKSEGEIRIGCRVEDGCWRFDIADNGPGIAPKYHKKIFQIFQTLSTDEAVQSTGVGLSLVKKIVVMYKGKISIESEVGKGTTFVLKFPQSAHQLEADAVDMEKSYA